MPICPLPKMVHTACHASKVLQQGRPLHDHAFSWPMTLDSFHSCLSPCEKMAAIMYIIIIKHCTIFHMLVDVNLTLYCV